MALKVTSKAYHILACHLVIYLSDLQLMSGLHKLKNAVFGDTVI